MSAHTAGTVLVLSSRPLRSLAPACAVRHLRIGSFAKSVSLFETGHGFGVGHGV